VTFLNEKGDQKCRESANSCGQMGADPSPMVHYTWGPPWRRKGGGEGGVCQMHRHALGQRPLGGGGSPAAGPQRAIGPFGGSSTRGPDDGTVKAPAWWAAAIPPTPALTAAGNPQW